MVDRGERSPRRCLRVGSPELVSPGFSEGLLHRGTVQSLVRVHIIYRIGTGGDTGTPYILSRLL